MVDAVGTTVYGYDSVGPPSFHYGATGPPSFHYGATGQLLSEDGPWTSDTVSYSYDLNGNLLTDGTRHFGYDDENQLISVWQVNAWSNNFVYDGKMRRRIERDFTWNAGSSGWLLTNEVHFIYDGNLVVQERDINNQPQVTYTRGNDLSGKLQGAGGIGGLLARNDRAQAIPGLMGSGGVSEFGTPSYYHADGNGVTRLPAPV